MATRYNFFGGLVTDGLVLDLDAAKLSSYPAGGTAWIDISGNGNNGVLTNGPTFSGVGKQAAIVFDGTNDSVIITSNATLSAGTGDFTYTVWVYPIAYDVYAPLFVAAATNGIWIGNNGSNFVLRAYAVADRLSFGTLPPLNAWTNITITRVGTTASLYYNSVLKTTSTTSQDFIQATTCIGSDGPPGFVYSWYNGRIANTLFYKGKGLSAFEIWQNFNAYKSRYGIPDIVTNGLVLNLDAGNPYSYYSPTSGTTWTDVSGNGNNGTLVNGPSYSNGAITFDGVDDYASLTAGGMTSFGTGDFTISAWVYFNTVSGLTNYRTILSTYTTGTSASDYIFGLYTTGTPNFQMYVAGINTNGSTVLTTGRWYNLVGSRISGIVSLYVNNVLDNTPTSAPGSINDSIAPRIGMVPGASQTGYFGGLISNVLVYKNKGLTQAEIAQNFNALRGRYSI